MGFDLEFEGRFSAMALGAIPNAQRRPFFGEAPANPGDNTFHEIWDVNGDYTWPTTAVTPTIVSDQAADDSAGTGARTVMVEGLDANYAEQSETVIMDGATPVSLANSYIRLHRAYVITAGTGLVNAGNIDVKDGATILLRIRPDNGQSAHGMFTVPASYTALIYAENYSADAAWVPARFHRSVAGILTIEANFHNSVAAFDHPLEHMLPVAVPEKTDIVAKAKSAGAVNCSALFDLAIIRTI
jgi:hypothetical protein